MNNILNNMKGIYKLSEILVIYSNDPKEGITKLSSLSDKYSNINKDAIYNINTGMSSEFTYTHAVNLGRGLFKEIGNDMTNNLSELFKNSDSKLSEFFNTMKNDFKAFNSYFTIGMPNIQLEDLKQNPLRQKYFLEKLQVNFLPKLTNFSTGLEYKLGLKNLISIMKERLDYIETKPMESFEQDIKNVENIFSYIKDAVKETTDIIPLESKEEKILEASVIRYEMPSMSTIGRRLNELAPLTKSIDQDVDVMSGLYSLPDMFDRALKPLVVRLETFLNDIERYKKVINEPRVNSVETIKNILEEYSDARTLEKDFIVKITNSINILVRSMDCGTFIHNKAFSIYQNLHRDILDYILLFNIFFEMIKYNITENDLNKEKE